MKYAALIYSAEGSGPEPGTDSFNEIMSGYFQFTQDLTDAGANLGGEALQEVATATCVQVRNGETLTIDGPFAETKEQLGGFYMIEAANLDEALAWAAKIPGALHGTIEVRPIMDYGEAAG